MAMMKLIWMSDVRVQEFKKGLLVHVLWKSHSWFMSVCNKSQKELKFQLQ